MAITLYKGEKICIADRFQVGQMEKAGWSTVPVDKEAEAKAKAEEEAKAKAEADAKAKAEAKAKEEAEAKATAKVESDVKPATALKRTAAKKTPRRRTKK